MRGHWLRASMSRNTWMAFTLTFAVAYTVNGSTDVTVAILTTEQIVEMQAVGAIFTLITNATGNTWSTWTLARFRIARIQLTERTIRITIALLATVWIRKC